MMLCSVIIPLYNKEKYIDTAIRSVLKQTYAQFEIVVIDDGSTDRGADLVKAIDDSRIRLISKPNGGVSRARNLGIECAKGELIFFLDADDWYDSHYLEVVISMASKFPTNSFYATGFQDVLDYHAQDWDSEPKSPLPFDVITDFYQRRFRSGMFFFTSSVAIKRSNLMALQPCFPINESMGEDQDLWFRLAERINLVYCPLKLTAYRNNVSDSLCSTIKSDVLLPVYARLEQRAMRGMLNKQARAFALLLAADERVNVARYLFSEGRRFDAIRELTRGFRALVKKRWWVTLFMCLFGSPGMLESLVSHRDQRFKT